MATTEFRRELKEGEFNKGEAEIKVDVALEKFRDALEVTANAIADDKEEKIAVPQVACDVITTIAGIEVWARASDDLVERAMVWVFRTSGDGSVEFFVGPIV